MDFRNISLSYKSFFFSLFWKHFNHKLGQFLYSAATETVLGLQGLQYPTYLINSALASRTTLWYQPKFRWFKWNVPSCSVIIQTHTSAKIYKMAKTPKHNLGRSYRPVLPIQSKPSGTALSPTHNSVVTHTTVASAFERYLKTFLQCLENAAHSSRLLPGLIASTIKNMHYFSLLKLLSHVFLLHYCLYCRGTT